MSNALIIFIKKPRPGKVKTRLALSVGDANALHIYKQLLKHTHKISLAVNAERFLFYDECIDQDDEWENEYFNKQLQTGNDLGEKMNNAFSETLSRFKNVAIIGSDCFDLTASVINEAFQLLKNNDVVIGPATDGGYYLLARKKKHPSLFKNISWSTPQVLEQTTAICKKQELSYCLLPTLSDIDVEDDLNSEQKKYLLKKNSGA
ncbi:MAG: TIGR04282 family arsenosugar biosynthesis glycosyltransferase [Chitinophagaceae bacterium]|nr:TIGR04282 family arsenosugar biosynthesis glycosyltransferase [Chitinophagaceae bacterium]